MATGTGALRGAWPAVRLVRERRRSDARALPALCLLALGAVLVALGAWWVLGDNAAAAKYEGLARETVADASAGGEGSGDAGAEAAAGRDWDALLAVNPDVAAWVSVANTNIDYPVMQPGDDKEDGYYLTHDMWGDYSRAGCPYLERGSTATGRHSLVYGHHMGTTGKIFSNLAGCWEQGSFDALGELTWETPDGETKVLQPVCALTVDKSYQPIQTYDFGTRAELRTWLRGICAEASALSADWESECDGAGKVVTLVTCTSMVAGQAARTLVVFAGN